MNFQVMKVMISFLVNGVYNIGQFKSEIKNFYLEGYKINFCIIYQIKECVQIYIDR